MRLSIKMALSIFVLLQINHFAQENNSISFNKSIYDTLKYNCNKIHSSDVYLNTEPQDAKIFIGDSLLGYSPLFINNNYANIRIEKNGYKSILLNIIKLKENSTIKIEPNTNLQKIPFYEKASFKPLIAGAIILGAISAYLKLKADDHYSNYFASGNENELKITKKYDLLSGLSFGALQINFGILIYYFLNE